MRVPEWLKVRSVYAARAAGLSLIGSRRFYNPVSAVRYCFRSDSTKAYKAIEVLKEEKCLRIWRTPLGNLATMDTEEKFHLAYIISEFQNDIYLSGAVRICPGAIVLDVGANIGLFAKKAVSKGASRVISFEPAPGNARAFRWNLARDIAKGQVSLVPKGAWNTNGILNLIVDSKNPGRSSCVVPPPDTSTYQVPVDVAPLDEIVGDLDIPRVDFVKMDIEGAELMALEGAKTILRCHKPQLAIAVEHTADRLRNASLVRQLVLHINPTYRCIPGPYRVTNHCLAPEVLYFK